MNNFNPLQASKFQLNFARLPGVQFACQSVNLPGLSLEAVYRETPFVDIPSPSDKVFYDALTVELLADDQLNGWREIHDWIRAMTFPTEFEEYLQLSRINSPSLSARFPQFSDAGLTILSNKNNPSLKFNFIDIFPVSLGGINLNTMLSPETPVTYSATFRYSYYNYGTV